MPAGTYLRTFCIGEWDRLKDVYRSLCAFAEENRLELYGYAYEEGLNEMSLGGRDDYITMITVGCGKKADYDRESGGTIPAMPARNKLFD